ncbi:MAG: butyrate kinase [Firmicutes bacterium]|nr:butyrate kinase [Bacillota bacterium]
MVNNIFVINTGSTSTKFALYADEKVVLVKKTEHSPSDLAPYAYMGDQLEFRTALAEEFVQQIEEQYPLNAVVARGGMLSPVKAGCYRINEALCKFLQETKQEHASNLSPPIAAAIAKKYHLSHAYIYDPISVDELTPIAQISGIPDLRRNSFTHALNMRSIAHKAAAQLGKKYNEAVIIVAHLGGGFSLSIHSMGKMIDIISDDEGPFSPERAGRQQATALTKYLFGFEGCIEEKLRILRGGSGLRAHLGCSDAREVEERIKANDKQAELVYQAMAYQTAKGIGELATVAYGKVDAIALTGGIAVSSYFTNMIKERVAFIAPVLLFPGENEMESLALGALRVLRGAEIAQEFV